MLLPNGITVFRVADGHDFSVDTMVLAGEALRPFPCPTGVAESPVPAYAPLAASALRTEVPGHTFYGAPQNFFPVVFGAHLTMFVAADGGLYGRFHGGPHGGTADDVGRWHITPAGQFCRTWHVWDDRRERCFTVSQEGETFTFFPQDRFGKGVSRRVPGNPEGF